jgi:hypothetical protein
MGYAQAISAIKFFYLPIEAERGPYHVLILYNAIFEGAQTAVSAFFVTMLRGDVVPNAREDEADLSVLMTTLPTAESTIHSGCSPSPIQATQLSESTISTTETSRGKWRGYRSCQQTTSPTKETWSPESSILEDNLRTKSSA